MTLSKPRVIVDMLYNAMWHIHHRPEEKDGDWLVEAIQNAENISTDLAGPEKASRSYSSTTLPIMQ